MILQATNINDITFRTMDVVLIVGGVISILGSFFVLRFQSQSTKEKLYSFMETTNKEVDRIEKELEKIGEVHGDFKEKIFKKMDDQNGEIHKLALSVEGFKNEILKELKK